MAAHLGEAGNSDEHSSTTSPFFSDLLLPPHWFHVLALFSLWVPHSLRLKNFSQWGKESINIKEVY